MKGETPKQCDNASAGVMIGDGDRWLFFERATAPAGIAPCAGHVFDEHSGYEDAAVAEVREELGLTVTSLTPALAGGWRPNRCRRLPGPKGTGHDWRVFAAGCTGRIRPSPREARRPRWIDSEEMQDLALRTFLRASGIVSREEFEDRPGIEPVWCLFLCQLGLIRFSGKSLALIDRLAAGEEP